MKKKSDKNRVEYLSWAVNRSSGQTNFLYELCDYDFDKLLKLEAVLKKFHYYSCPNNKEVVNALLMLDLEQTYSKEYLSSIL